MRTKYFEPLQKQRARFRPSKTCLAPTSSLLTVRRRFFNVTCYVRVYMVSSSTVICITCIAAAHYASCLILFFI